jgi:hypothetical protein
MRQQIRKDIYLAPLGLGAGTKSAAYSASVYQGNGPFGYHPGSWSPSGSQDIPNPASAKRPRKEPSAATIQHNVFFGFGRMAGTGHC